MSSTAMQRASKLWTRFWRTKWIMFDHPSETYYRASEQAGAPFPPPLPYERKPPLMHHTYEELLEAGGPEVARLVDPPAPKKLPLPTPNRDLPLSAGDLPAETEQADSQIVVEQKVEKRPMPVEVPDYMIDKSIPNYVKYIAAVFGLGLLSGTILIARTKKYIFERRKETLRIRAERRRELKEQGLVYKVGKEGENFYSWQMRMVLLHILCFGLYNPIRAEKEKMLRKREDVIREEMERREVREKMYAIARGER